MYTDQLTSSPLRRRQEQWPFSFSFSKFRKFFESLIAQSFFKARFYSLCLGQPSSVFFPTTGVALLLPPVNESSPNENIASALPFFPWPPLHWRLARVQPLLKAFPSIELIAVGVPAPPCKNATTSLFYFFPGSSEVLNSSLLYLTGDASAIFFGKHSFFRNLSLFFFKLCKADVLSHHKGRNLREIKLFPTRECLFPDGIKRLAASFFGLQSKL